MREIKVCSEKTYFDWLNVVFSVGSVKHLKEDIHALVSGNICMESQGGLHFRIHKSTLTS